MRKRCSSCRAWKPIEEFHRNRASTDGDGRHNQCKPCKRESDRRSRGTERQAHLTEVQREHGRDVWTDRFGFELWWTEERIVARIKAWVATRGIPPTWSDWGPGRLGKIGTTFRSCRIERRWPTYETVRERFGTFEAGIRAAGFEPATKVRTWRPTDAQRRRMAEGLRRSYAEGRRRRPTAAAAEHMRAVGAAKVCSRREEQQREVYALLDAGVAKREVARITGRARRTVQLWAAEREASDA